MTMNPTSNDDMSISGADRLSNIEALLQRVLDKLDTKVEVAALAALENRVRDMELHGSSHATQALAEVRLMAKTMDALNNKVASYSGGIAVIVVGLNVGLYLLSH